MVGLTKGKAASKKKEPKAIEKKVKASPVKSASKKAAPAKATKAAPKKTPAVAAKSAATAPKAKPSVKAAPKKTAPKKAVSAKTVSAKKPTAPKKAVTAKTVTPKKTASKKVVAKASVSKKAVEKVVAPKKAVAKAAPLKAAPKKKVVGNEPMGLPEQLRDAAMKVLDDRKAEDIICVDLRGRSAIADYALIATGGSARQLSAVAEYLREAFFKLGMKKLRIEGLPQGDWVLVDAGDVLIHLFRPEVRTYYQLEDIWSARSPSSTSK